jgi:hypothetical protein
VAKGFSLDLSPLLKAIEQSPEAAGRGAKRGLDDVKDDWVRESRDMAPIDSGNLRRQINGEVDNPGLSGEIVVSVPAMSKWRGRPFNYAYYIHEENAGGKSLRTSGTVKKFLDESAVMRESTWQKMLEKEIEEELKRKGW